MKLKNIKQKNYRLLKIYLLRLGICFKEINNKDSKITFFINNELEIIELYPSIRVYINNKLEIIELHFKTAIKILQDYHQSRQKILFISTQSYDQDSSLPLLQKVIEKTHHTFIETSDWTPGTFKCCSIFLQQIREFQKISKNPSLFSIRKKMLEKLINKPALIVITTPYIDPIILDEINLLNIPVISFYHNLKLNKYITYKTINNISIKSKQANFYSLLLHSIFKK